MSIYPTSLPAHIKVTGKEKNILKVWDYTFEVGPEHLTKEQCEQLRASYDTLADECWGLLREIADRDEKEKQQAEPEPETEPEIGKQQDESEEKKQSEVQNHQPIEQDEKKYSSSETKAESKPSRPRKKQDMFELLQRHHDEHPTLSRLWEQANTVPDWVDWDQIQRGQDIFYRYAAPMFVALTYASLLGGMGAHRVVETLVRTGGFSTKVARGRLFETTQFVLEVTRGVESMMPEDLRRERRKEMDQKQASHGLDSNSKENNNETVEKEGAGWKSCIRVRLLHSAVRQRILALTQNHPNYYSVTENGIPINDLHSIGTIGTFAASLIYRSLPRQGIYLRSQEIEDYIALWRLVAWYMGCPTEHFETAHRASQIMESLLMWEVNPSETSKIMADNILDSIAGTPPAYPSRPFLEASARWVNGDDLCDALGLPRPPLYYKLLMAGQCLFFMAFVYINRAVPAWDRDKVERLRRLTWKGIVEADYGLKGEVSSFELKWVPELGGLTKRDGKETAKQLGIPKVGRREGEMRAAIAILVGVVLFAAMGSVGWIALTLSWRFLIMMLSSPTWTQVQSLGIW